MTKTTSQRAHAFYSRHGIGSLLSDPTANPKIAKNQYSGIMTAPLHLAPADLSGFEVCPMRSSGCTKACLHTAGNPVYMANKAAARIKRTRAYFEDRAEFMVALAFELAGLQKRAHAAGMQPGARLNATSDIPWERVPIEYDGRTYSSVMAAFPAIEFYDYTKRYNRRNLPNNYTLTFSLAENNEHHAADAFAHGMNVAVVFNVAPRRPLPATYTLWGRSIPVIDGDVSDWRPGDQKGVIVGLRAKGDARKDASGFVRHVA